MSEQDLTKGTEETGGLLAPVLPLRDIVVFPHMIVPLFVGREKSVRALEEVMSEEKQILLLTQKNAADDDPSPDGLHTYRHAGDRASASEAARSDRSRSGRRQGARARDRLRCRAPISSRRPSRRIPDDRARRRKPRR